MMKLSEHDVPDVRTLVPDCPEWMARLIHSMTRRAPELRPSSAADVLEAWTKHNRGGNPASRAIVRQMPDLRLHERPAGVRRPLVRRSQWFWPLAASTVLIALTIVAARFGSLPRPLRFGVWTGEPSTEPVDPAGLAAASMTVPESTGPLPLPQADRNGLIHLQPGGVYLASSQSVSGALRLVNEGARLATLLVPASSPLTLTAARVELRGLRLQQDSRAAVSDAPDAAVSAAGQLVAVNAAVLTVEDCHIQSPSSAEAFAAIAWYAPPEAATEVIIRNSILAGGGYGISFSHPPQRVELNNVLLANRGSGLLCEFGSGDPDLWRCDCRNVTQRFGFSVADVVVHDDGPARIQLTLSSQDCVFAPRMSVVRFQTPDTWKPPHMDVRFLAGETGNPALISPETQPAVWIDPALQRPVSLPETQLVETVLLLAELEFQDAGDSEMKNTWEGSVLRDFEGPRLTNVMPGIDPGRLPAD
jgi:hypothetical protein